MKWGIIGTGTIAKKFAATIAQMQAEGETLVAVASRTMEAAEAFRAESGALRAYGTYAGMMANPQMDAVYIATPNTLHFENAQMCLQNGKHVLCEKPFTLNAKQSRALYALAREKNLFIMEAFWIRFLPLLAKMRAIIAAGEIGAVRHMRSEYGFIPSEALKVVKRTAALGAGALMDIGIYNIGLAHMVMDAAPVRISSTVQRNEYGADDFSAVLLEYPGGRSASFATSIGMDMPREAAIFGTEGEISMPDFQCAERLHVRRYDGKAYDVEMPFDVNGFEYEIREVNRCVKLGLHTSDILREQDSLMVMETMDALRAAWGVQFEGDA